MKITQEVFRSTVLAPITAATTARTASIDVRGADYATIEILCGAELNTNNTNVLLNLKENDSASTTSASTFNSSFAVTTDNTSAQLTVFNVDLKGRKGYLILSVTPDTTTNGPILTTVISNVVKDQAGANSSNADVVVVG